jgi:hypothetical protein
MQGCTWLGRRRRPKKRAQRVSHRSRRVFARDRHVARQFAANARRHAIPPTEFHQAALNDRVKLLDYQSFVHPAQKLKREPFRDGHRANL